MLMTTLPATVSRIANYKISMMKEPISSCEWTNVCIYLKTKVLHGYIKPIFITLRKYINFTISVIEIPFQKELSSQNIFEKRPLWR